MSTAPKPRQPMTPEETSAVDALQRVTFPMASPPKRFAREMAGHPEITDGQRDLLWKIAWRFRRQIKSLKIRRRAWDLHGHTTKEPRP